MEKEILENYAKAIVEVGINLQRGQSVVIRLEPELEEFATLVATHCYIKGAKQVVFSYTSSRLTHVALKYSNIEDLSIVNQYEEGYYKFTAEEKPCLIWLDGEDPDGLLGVDSNKVAAVKKNKMKVLLKYIEAYDNQSQWTIVGVPTKRWAKKMFPDMNEEEAVEKLWKLILITARSYSGNSVDNWNEHQANFKKRSDYINSLNLVSLHYKSKKGTDLTVGLIKGVKFLGGSEEVNGIEFQPNMPTEEIFTSPMKGEAEGIVYSTKPLCYQGQMIEDFYVRFHEGKAVEADAKVGKEALLSILTLDEGSAYLGECALVPVTSYVNKAADILNGEDKEHEDVLFYNTLFDENAACHLALGKGFINLYPDYEKYSADEIYNKGINKSFSHVDFMIGDETLSITGRDENGKEYPLIKDGLWAF